MPNIYQSFYDLAVTSLNKQSDCSCDTDASEEDSSVAEKEGSGAPSRSGPSGAGAGAVNTKPDISKPRITTESGGV